MLRNIALVAVLSTVAGAPVFAQTRPAAHSNVETTSIREQIRRLQSADATQGAARQSDSLWNGALIGAGVAVASGLFLCTRTEPWENCRDDVGPMLRIGALGAGIGLAIDALIRRSSVDHTVPDSTQLRTAPIVTPHARGLQMSVTF
jgi:hypothetical protein